MDKCPPEICLQIFRLACVDDGTTGRSLSLVSRYINETSAELKLQCISVVGLAQIVHCAEMLRNTPPKLRRVRHLFLSNCPQLSAPPSGVGAIARLYEPANRTVGRQEHYEGVCEAFADILRLTAPSLRTCYVVSNIARTATLLPVSLPELEELTLHGPFPAWTYPDSKAQVFRSLKRLRFIGFTDYPMDMFEDIADQSPALTELTFMPAQASRHLHTDLEAALDIRASARNFFSETVVSQGKLPQHLQKVYIQPGPKPAVLQGQWLRDVQRAMIRKLNSMSKKDRRIVVLPPGPISGYSETKAQWLVELDAVKE